MFKLSPSVVSPRDPGSQRWSKTLLFLDVPTFTTSRLPRDSSSQKWNYVGEKWPMNFAWNARLPRSIQWSFTCRKSTTWDRRLYFPSEGRRAEDFFTLKNPTASAGFEPANLVTKGQHATSRPPKPLYCSVTSTHIWQYRVSHFNTFYKSGTVINRKYILHDALSNERDSTEASKLHMNIVVYKEYVCQRFPNFMCVTLK